MQNTEQILKVVVASILTLIMSAGGLLFMTISTEAPGATETESGKIIVLVTFLVTISLIGLMWWGLFRKGTKTVSSSHRNISAITFLICALIWAYFSFVGVPSRLA